MNLNDCFASDYQGAREKFLNAANAKSLAVESYKHALTGANDEELYTDVVWIGPKDAKRVLVTSSSTHGAEGFLGSGVQVGALCSGKYDKLPESTAVLLIHAINPWGFSWLRRTNEDGVDLFRNFIDFDQPRPQSDLYDQLVDHILPKKINFLSKLKMIAATLRHDRESIKSAIPAGQYKHALAPFYGGSKATWSNQILRALIKKHLQNAEQVFAIDYHTGLGEFGVGELIGFDKPGDTSFEIARECWGPSYISAYSSESTAYEIHGILKNAYSEGLVDTQLLFAAHEFGTYNETQIFKVLQQDHWLHAYGDMDTSEARHIKAQMKKMFYCDSDEWRDTVLGQAFNAEKQALDFLI